MTDATHTRVRMIYVCNQLPDILALCTVEMRALRETRGNKAWDCCRKLQSSIQDNSSQLAIPATSPLQLTLSLKDPIARQDLANHATFTVTRLQILLERGMRTTPNQRLPEAKWSALYAFNLRVVSRLDSGQSTGATHKRFLQCLLLCEMCFAKTLEVC